MITTLLTLGIGFCLGVITVVSFIIYHYYKAVKEAHEDGWDIPHF
jgi:hypothetical protein